MFTIFVFESLSYQVQNDSTTTRVNIAFLKNMQNISAPLDIIRFNYEKLQEHLHKFTLMFWWVSYVDKMPPVLYKKTAIILLGS